MRAREVAIGPVPCLALRVTTWASSAGSLRPDGARPPALGHDLGRWPRARARGGRLQGDRLLPAREGLPRGARTSRQRTRPTRPASGSRSSSTRASSSGGTLAAAKDDPLERKLARLLLEDPRSIALGSEPVLVNGEVAGRVTSGGFGYTVGRSIAYAYLPGDAVEPGNRVEVEIFDALSPAKLPWNRSTTPMAQRSVLDTTCPETGK